MRQVLLPLASAAVAIVVVVGLVLFLTQPDEVVVAGEVDDFEVGEPVHFEDSGFFVVRLESDEVIALSDVSPHEREATDARCTVQWLPEFEFQGVTGWFRTPCLNSTFAVDGKLAFGPSPRGMNRYAVSVAGGQVRVDTGGLMCAPSAQPSRCPY